MTDHLEGRRRAQQPTSFERKLGFREAPTRRTTAQRPQPYCAPTPEQAARDRANNKTLRLSHYLTTKDTFRGWE